MHLYLRPRNDLTNALTKLPMRCFFVTATSIAVYLYATAGDEGFRALRDLSRGMHLQAR